MKPKLLFPLLAAAFALGSFLDLSAVAADTAADTAEAAVPVFTCHVPGLAPVDAPAAEGLRLPFTPASVAARDYDFPGTDIRVSIQARFLGTRVEITKTFFQKVGAGVKLMMVFVAPTSLDLPLVAGAQYVLKSGGGGTVPAFELDCQLTAAK